jgi:hypothetical protein
MTGSPKQSIAPQQASVDCFVAEFVVGPAEGGTRWLLAIMKRKRRAIARLLNDVGADRPA